VTGKGFCGRVPMQVSPLETTNKFDVLTTEETQNECFLSQNQIVFELSIMFPNSFQNCNALHFNHKNQK